MEEIIKRMTHRAEEERDEVLAEEIRDLIETMAQTINCPSNWRDIGSNLEAEYAKKLDEDDWVYENLALWNHKEEN